MRLTVPALLLVAGLLALGRQDLLAQERGPTPASPDEIRQAIGKLGDLDYATRMGAGRTIRRAPAAQVVTALLQAVNEHADGYIRYKALILLTGFNDPRTVDTMREAMVSPNDRLREVAFAYFEQSPDPSLAARMLAALDKEEGEFVRPALIRALAAIHKEPKVSDALIRDAGRGIDFFRSTVIEAIGDYKVVAAVPSLTAIARIDGPLRDDAATALGKIGDQTALGTLAELQRTASKEVQPAIAAAICLMGASCSAHIGYLEKTLTFADTYPGFQDLLRGAAAGLGNIARQGNDEALSILFRVGIPSQDPVRAPVTLALGLVALRNTPLMLKALASQPNQAAAVGILAEAFDMLEEDFEEERFFVAVRRAYWSAANGSATRKLCELLITKLDF
ncbi:MAG: HEAT repeat domain-containing protein [Acidobacteria bacterium]|nr:HEAT repeat domain-containing protein [Acidobacteriota bacterium]MSO62992.1 HEAT repeat domain-containing protein [Acidobacteriota bacterium]